MSPRSLLFIAAAGLLIAAPLAYGQQPPKEPPAPDQSKLPGHLENWEKAMAKVDTLIIDCNRTDKKITFNSTDLFTGKAFFMKDKKDIFILIQMEKMDKKDPKQKDKSGLYERYVCNPTACYEYVPAEKKIRYRMIPAAKEGQIGDDNLLSFLFGMNAKQATSRYKLKLLKEDDWYVYVEVVPTRADDKLDFETARVCLDKSNYLPRQLWFRQNNGDEVTWDLPSVNTKDRIDRKYFEKPDLPSKDWKFEEIKKEDVPPRVVRPKDGK
jgi:TIGR03009 family protein